MGVALNNTLEVFLEGKEMPLRKSLRRVCDEFVDWLRLQADSAQQVVLYSTGFPFAATSGSSSYASAIRRGKVNFK